MSQTVNQAGVLRIELQDLNGQFLPNPTLEAGDVMLYAGNNQPVELEAVVNSPFVDVSITAAQNNIGEYHVKYSDQSQQPEWADLTVAVCPTEGSTGSSHTPADVVAALLGADAASSPLLAQVERTDGPLDKTFKDGDNISVSVGAVTRIGLHTKV